MLIETPVPSGPVTMATVCHIVVVSGIEHPQVDISIGDEPRGGDHSSTIQEDLSLRAFGLGHEHVTDLWVWS